MEKDIEREREIRNAIASSEMEGFHVSPEMESQIRKIVSGELSIDEAVKEILAKTNGPRD
jgi:hypothetical protein